MSPSDYNNDGQPEIAIWPPKPVVVIPPELQQVAWNLQQQVRNFRLWRGRINCRQVIATMAGNQKRQCVPQKRKYLYIHIVVLAPHLSQAKKVIGLYTVSHIQLNFLKVLFQQLHDRDTTPSYFGHVSNIFHTGKTVRPLEVCGSFKSSVE